MRVRLAIPVLDPGERADELVRAILAQRRLPDEIVVLDSESTDGSVARFEVLRAQIVRVRRAAFDHGATRNLALLGGDWDVCIFLTQDAIPNDGDAFARLLSAFEDNPRVGLAFGRQLPHHGAGLIASHARGFNYPDSSVTRTRADLESLGVRAAFCSNSFSGYRREAVAEVGGFPERQIFGEDAALAARLLAADWQVAYVAEARVRHSHDYTVREEVARYFDLGVFHSTDDGIKPLAQSSSGEGLRFVRSELAFLRARLGLRAFPRVLVRNGLRWVGYQLGRRHRLLPRGVRARVGMNKDFWRSS